MIYQDTKIQVIEFKNKIKVINKVSCEIIVFDREVFFKMCKEVSKKKNERPQTESN
jgi:hypothetical protein